MTAENHGRQAALPAIGARVLVDDLGTRGHLGVRLDGEPGTVAEVNDDHIGIALDRPFPALAEWRNRFVISPDDAPADDDDMTRAEMLAAAFAAFTTAADWAPFLAALRAAGVPADYVSTGGGCMAISGGLDDGRRYLLTDGYGDLETGPHAYAAPDMTPATDGPARWLLGIYGPDDDAGETGVTTDATSHLVISTTTPEQLAGAVRAVWRIIAG